MIHIKKLSLCIGLVVLTIMMGGCGLMSNKNEIKESFEEKLSIYPIKNLEDFYDKEGFRDSEFDENDKGTWYLYSRMAIQTSGDKDLISKGMLLRINRNTRTTEENISLELQELIKVRRNILSKWRTIILHQKNR